MTNFTEKLLAFTGRRRRWCAAAALLLGLLAAAGVFRVDFTNDVSQLFPTPRSRVRPSPCFTKPASPTRSSAMP